MNPTLGQIHIDRPLSDIAFANFNDDANFIAGIVAPTVPVKQQSDKYFIYDSGDLNRDDADIRANGTESVGGGFDLSTDSYICKVYARHHDITLQDLANSDLPNLRITAAKIISNKLKIRRERIFMEKFFTTGVWTNQGAPTTKWDAASSHPIRDIKTEVNNIISRTGINPANLILTCSPNTLLAIMEADDVLRRTIYVTTSPSTLASLATTLGIGRVVVANAIYNSAAKGATNALGFVAQSESALLSYAAPSPSLYDQSAMYNFIWTGLDGIGQAGPSIQEISVPLKKATRIEGELAFDMKITSQAAAHFFYDCLT